MVKSFKALASVVFLVIFFGAAYLSAATMPITLNWASKLKSGRTASNKTLNFATPTVVGLRVYVGSVGKKLYAINLLNGKKIWEATLQGPVLSSPAHDNGVLYIGDGKGEAYAINAENGSINWHSYIGEEIMTTPAVDETSVYIATQNNALYALDKSAGTTKWTTLRPMPFSSMTIKGHSSPVIIDEKIYVGNTDGVLVVYDPIDGKKLKIIPVAVGRGRFTDIDTTVLKEGSDLFFSSMEGGLYSMNYKTGKEKWAKSIGTPNNIVYRDGLIYLSTDDKVYCLKMDNGEEVWAKALEVPGLSEVALGKSHAAVVSTDDKLYLLDLTTGEVALERHLGKGTFGSPVVIDDRLLVLTNNGQLYSFKFSS